MSKFWRWPWGYGPNILVLLSIIINGFVIEYVAGVGGIKVPPFPFNLYILIGFLVISTVIFYLPICRRIVKWSLSYQFVITSITTFASLALISGFLPQGSDVKLPLWLAKLGFHHITSSVPYAMVLMLICFSLFCATMRKLNKKVTKNDVPFILNHVGLLIIFLCGSFGAGDLTRVKMTLSQDRVVWMAQDSSAGSTSTVANIEMPFALKLKKFDLEQYPAKIAFINTADNKILFLCPMVEQKTLKSYKCEHNGYKVTVNTLMNNGFFVKDKYVAVNHVGTSIVLEVTATDKDGKETKGWITPGSTYFNSEFLELPSGMSLAIPNPRPKKFESDIKYYTPQGETGEFSVLVNQPVVLKDWKLYQYGYDDRMGKWSTTSVIEAIKDPWLPFVYLGIYALIIGSVLMLFIEREES